MIHRSWLRTGVVTLLALFAPAIAIAESDFARLNQKGEEAYQAEHYPEAADLLQQAYAIKPVPALLFNIARAYERAGNDEQAIRFYQRYLDAQGTDAETVKKSARALDLLRTKQAQHQIDEAKAAADKAAADKAAQDKAAQDKAAADKAAADKAAQDQASTPSTTSPKPATTTAPPTSSSPATTATTAPPPEPQRSYVPGVALLGVGVAAGGVGVGFGVAASDKVTAFNRTFDSTRPSLKQSAQNDAHLADGFYAGGIVAAAVGAFLLVRAIPSAPMPSGPTALLVPRGAVVAWEGSW